MVDSCNWCKKPATKRCGGCRKVYYCDEKCLAKDWKDGGHKIFCKSLKLAIETAEPLIDTLDVPPNGADMFGNIESPQEREAQDLCYDAMEVDDSDLPRKIKLVIKALKVFPLSTEAWGMLGAHYRYYLPDGQRDYEQSVRMYGNAIKCARKLNPTWSDDRTERLEWGVIETRPYLRAVCGRALSLKELGRVNEAITEAKKLLRWNPSDNQGVRSILCNWLLEVGDTEACLNLIMDYQHDGNIVDTTLAYSHVLLQFLRWKKGDVLEEKAQKALCAALERNLYVPELLLREDPIEKKKIKYLDSGGPKDAHEYVYEAQHTWRAHSNSLQWLKCQKTSQNGEIPPDGLLVRLLRSEMDLLVHCEHTALNGTDKKISCIHATQRRDKCVGSALDDFYWPAGVDQEYSPGGPILLYRNDLFGDRDESSMDRWRKTTQGDIIEVPFWKVLVQGAEEGWFEDEPRREIEDRYEEEEEQPFHGLSVEERHKLQSVTRIENDDPPEMVEAAPKSFFCPISQEIMREPVMITATGSTFEKFDISQWFLQEDADQKQLTDPSTRIPVTSVEFTDNRVLRDVIEEWKRDWKSKNLKDN